MGVGLCPEALDSLRRADGLRNEHDGREVHDVVDSCVVVVEAVAIVRGVRWASCHQHPVRNRASQELCGASQRVERCYADLLR